MEQIIIGHVIAWAIAVAFMALFISNSFDWAVLPFVMAIPIAVFAAIRSYLFICRQRQATSFSS